MVPERLRPKAVEPSEVREFCALCDEIENGLHQKQDVSGLLARWNQRQSQAGATAASAASARDLSALRATMTS